jgi:hypothetical protein
VAIFTKFFGRAASDAAGFAAGIAVGPALGPVVQEVVNRAWEAHPDKRIDAGTAAAIVAEDVRLRDFGAAEAAAHGFDGDRFDALLGEALNGPGLGTLYDALRRDFIDDADFEHGLRKAKLEPRWDDALRKLRRVLLSPQEAANARQQGYLSAEQQVAIAELHGLNADDAETQFLTVGLPPGAATAQEYLNRGLIDDGTFAEMIREGHTKTKYTDVLRRGARYVLSPMNYVEGRLRGWLTDAEMYAGTSLHGVTQEDTDLLFKIHGRPISFHQTFIGTRRGGTLDGPIAGIDPAFLAALRRSNIQPPFYNLAWAQRYTYPSPFVLRSLTQSGDISEADAHEVLIFLGWEPTFAAKVSAAWAGGTSAATDAHVGKAQTQLWTTLHRSYIAGESTKTAARPVLASLGLTTAAQDQVLAFWDAERALVRKQLTPAQIKKAYVKGIKNQATGLTWTRDDALAALIERGYATTEANEFLDL